MALNAATAWEVRTDGNAANGGGFYDRNPGTSVDYSQQASPQLSVSDAVTSTTTLSSATGGFTAAMVGNIVQLSGGSGVTAGFYEIVGFTDTNTVTIDRTGGTGTGATANVGGALTLSAAIGSHLIGGNTVHVKSGAYTLSNATLTPPSAGTFPLAIVINGYNATRGDLDNATNFTNYPTVTKSAGTEAIWTLSNSGSRLRNFVLDGNGTATHGVNSSGAGALVQNVRVTGCTTFGFASTSSGAPSAILRCESYSNSGSASGFSLASTAANGCYAHDNPGSGFSLSANSILADCLTDTNGAHGVTHLTGVTYIHSLTAYGNTTDGVRIGAPAGANAIIRNCILASNGGYGINYNSTGTVTDTTTINANAYYNNTSGARNALPVGPNDVTLSADPFTNAASGNFALNNTAGGGAACRAAGFPGTFPGGLTTGYKDIGAVQHQDTPSGTPTYSRARVVNA